jgi:hypothetical protein
MPCPGTIEHRVSEDNYSYISQNAITGPSTCPGGGGVTGGGGTDPGQQVLIDLFRASLIQSSNTTVHLDFSEQRGRGKVRLDVDRKVHLDPTAVKPCKHKDVVRWRKSMMRSICPDSGIGTGRLGSDPVTLLNTGMQGGAAMFAVHLDAAPSFFPITLGPSDQGAPFGQQLTIDFTSMPAGFDSVDLRLRSTGKKRRFIRVSCPTTRVWQFRARVEDGGAVSPPKDVTQKCKG